MQKLIFEINIKNPNEQMYNPWIILFGLVAMFIGPLGGHVGTALGLSVMLGVIVYVTLCDNKKTGFLKIYELAASEFLIKIEGVDLDFSLEGKLSYEIWRKLIPSSKGGSTYKTPCISIRNNENPELLVQATGNDENDEKKWGVMREASSQAIGFILELNLSELEKLKNTLEEAI